MILNKINIIGQKWAHQFKKEDGTIFEVETTEQDYNDVSQQKILPPINENGVWTGGYCGTKFNTTSGNIEDGQYAFIGDRILAKVEGYRLTDLLLTDMDGNELLPSGIAKLWL